MVVYAFLKKVNNFLLEAGDKHTSAKMFPRYNLSNTFTNNFEIRQKGGKLLKISCALYKSLKGLRYPS